MFDFLKRRKEIFVVIEFRNDDTFSLSAHKSFSDAKVCMAAKAILAQDEKQSLGFNDSHIKSFTDEHALVEWDGGSQCYTYQLVKAPFYRYRI